jgi:hypothetical protein
MDQLVKEFFSRYARANSSSDLTTIGELYADTFMFGGPNGVQVVKKEDFLKVVPKMKAHFASMGVSETQLQRVQVSSISSKYLLANVNWRMTLGTSIHGKAVEALATYVLARGEEDVLSIVFQIDHQDLATLIRSRAV